MRGPIHKVRQPAPVLGTAERLAASGVSTAHGAPVRHQAQVREILCTPDLRQQLRFQGRFRYETQKKRLGIGPNLSLCLAGGIRFERTTSGFGGLRSIQLS